MRCPRCQAYCGRSDNYCRYCGLSLQPYGRPLGASASEPNLRLPVRSDGGAPAVWQQAAPAVVQGLAALALGAVAEMALRALARRAATSLPPLLAPRPKGRPLPAKPAYRTGKRDGHLPEPQATYAVSETVVMRRVTLRQGSGQALRR